MCNLWRGRPAKSFNIQVVGQQSVDHNLKFKHQYKLQYKPSLLYLVYMDYLNDKHI